MSETVTSRDPVRGCKNPEPETRGSRPDWMIRCGETILDPGRMRDLTFIRTSKWETHRVVIGKKDPDGELKALQFTDAGGMSRDLSIKGIHVKKGARPSTRWTKSSSSSRTTALFWKHENT